MASHTPRPWHIETVPIKRVDGSIRQVLRFIEHDSESPGVPTEIAEVYDRLHGEGEANAVLMAAAPELLSSLEALVWELEDWGPAGQEPLRHGTFEKAQAAIVKARGEFAND